MKARLLWRSAAAAIAAAILLLAAAIVVITSASSPRRDLTVPRSAGEKRYPHQLPAVGIAAGSHLQDWPPASVDRELDDYAELHATWIRHDFAWDAIEPQPGVFRWTGFDTLVNAARTRHLNVIATVGYTPAWANGGHADHRFAPTSAAQFGTFAGEVAARYAPLGVHVYEIWNEPNISYWQPAPDPAAYTAVLCAAFRAIHAADPQAIVLTGGASPAADTSTTFAPQTWLERLYRTGARRCFDGVGYHPYVDSTPGHGSLGGNWYVMDSEYADNLRTEMRAAGDAHKRIWATEVGCNRYVIGEAECADRLREALRLWRTYPWAAVLCWFTYWDRGAFGLVDGDWRRRPLWYAYRDAAGMTAGGG